MTRAAVAARTVLNMRTSFRAEHCTRLGVRADRFVRRSRGSGSTSGSDCDIEMAVLDRGLLYFLHSPFAS